MIINMASEAHILNLKKKKKMDTHLILNSETTKNFRDLLKM